MLEHAVDDPLLLKHIMSTAEPSKSRIGRMMETSRAHMQPFLATNRQKDNLPRNKRENQLQLQRENQAAWDVAAERKLQLPVLRTMAPSFVRAVSEEKDGMGGIVINEVGYKTIIGMLPTADNIRRIADDDELISSFRQYRIDALRAARQAGATMQSVPHPDESRQMEPTLRTLASNHLIDADAVPDDVLQKHREIASVFSTGVVDDGIIEAPQRQKKSDSAERLANLAGLRGSAPKGTSSFLAAPRFRAARNLAGVRQPDIGHYHQRYVMTEPRVVGGYIAPPVSAPQPQQPQPERPAESLGTPAESPMSETAAEFLMTDNTKTFRFSMNGTKARRLMRTKTFAASPREALQKSKTCGSYMFVSKTPREVVPICSAAKDLDYFPYADVRSTVKRKRCFVTFDAPVHQNRNRCATRVPAVGTYNVVADIANNPHRTVCMDRDTGRVGFWLNRRAACNTSSEYVDVSDALKAVHPRVRVARMVAQVREDKSKKGKHVRDITVSVERDLNFPRSVFDSCEAKRVRRFETMTGRCFKVSNVSCEAPETIDMTHVTKRTPQVIIHPSAPGHAPLHQTQQSDIGNVPNLKWVKPTTERSACFGAVPSVAPLQPPARDLWYDTSKRSLVEPRIKGNPMIESQVSRDKRAKVFSTAGCGAHVVYNIDIPQRCKSVPLFEKQITKEAQFCGHRLQSERWQRKNPRAPGPGYYNVSYKLVE